MFVSRKRWKALEKRVADLERQIQSQPENTIEIINELTKNDKKSPLII